MKKNLFRLLTLLMALCLILCGCGSASDNDDDKDEGEKKETSIETTAAPSDEELIVGTWVGTVDCGDYFLDVMTQSAGEELGAYFDFTGLGFELTITFTEDGKCTLEITDEAAEAFGEDILNALMEGMHAYLEEALVDSLNGQTLDEFLAANNMTFEELMAASGVDMEAMAEEMVSSISGISSESEYSLNDGKIDLDGDISEYELSATSITIYAPEGSEGTEMYDVIFPLELEKVN